MKNIKHLQSRFKKENMVKLMKVKVQEPSSDDEEDSPKMKPMAKQVTVAMTSMKRMLS